MTQKDRFISYIIDYFVITIGSVLAALALEVFLIPNLIIDGGLTGIAILLNILTSVKLGIFIVCLNIPFLMIGYKQMGKQFLFKASYAMIVFSILLSFFHTFNPATYDILLATAFGGIILGIGVGLVIRHGGCLDGTEVIAILISKKTSFSVGQVVLIFNILIYGVSSLLFGLDKAMYSALTYFITFKIIDIVEEGLDQARAVMIITDHSNDIANNIYKQLGRTVTILEGEGLVSGKKVILYSVITRMEVSALKKIVQEDDSSAFVTITEVSEVLGKHIKKNDSNIV